MQPQLNWVFIFVDEIENSLLQYGQITIQYLCLPFIHGFESSIFKILKLLIICPEKLLFLILG